MQEKIANPLIGENGKCAIMSKGYGAYNFNARSAWESAWTRFFNFENK